MIQLCLFFNPWGKLKQYIGTETKHIVPLNGLLHKIFLRYDESRTRVSRFHRQRVY